MSGNVIALILDSIRGTSLADLRQTEEISPRPEMILFMLGYDTYNLSITTRRLSEYLWSNGTNCLYDTELPRRVLIGYLQCPTQ